MVFLETTRNFERDLIEGVAQYAKQCGHWLLQLELRGMEVFRPEIFHEWRGDGLIAHSIDDKQSEMLLKMHLPIVDVGGNPAYGITPIDWDDMAMSRLAVEHFLDRGFRHFGYFSYAHSWWLDLHILGYRQAIEAHGYDCHVYPAPLSQHAFRLIWQEDTRPQIVEWLRSLPRPIGIYTSGDWSAVRLLEICREIGIAVPEDVAILGLENDATLCESVQPTLSSVEIDSQRVGYEAASLLDRIMDGEKPPKDIVRIPPTRVVVRQSTDLMLIEDADVVRALQFIRKHAAAHIDVDRIAENVGLSRSALQRKFQQHLQRTPKSEIMRVRIELAKSLLTQTEKINESLAHRCGFSSLRYFTMAFCRETGMTPAAYRRTQRKTRIREEQ
jgi:LacI family transcriptional regulator